MIADDEFKTISARGNCSRSRWNTKTRLRLGMRTTYATRFFIDPQVRMRAISPRVRQTTGAQLREFSYGALPLQASRICSSSALALEPHLTTLTPTRNARNPVLRPNERSLHPSTRRTAPLGDVGLPHDVTVLPTLTGVAFSVSAPRRRSNTSRTQLAGRSRPLPRLQ